MTYELTLLAWNVVLLVALIILSSNANVMTMGMAWGIGNRDEPATTTGWGARTKRAYLNHLENLLCFGLLVLIAHAANIHSDLTILAAQLFLAGRVAHAIVYIAGWTFLWIRTLVYFVALIGTILMAYAVLTTAPMMAA